MEILFLMENKKKEVEVLGIKFITDKVRDAKNQLIEKVNKDGTPLSGTLVIELRKGTSGVIIAQKSIPMSWNRYRLEKTEYLGSPEFDENGDPIPHEVVPTHETIKRHYFPELFEKVEEKSDEKESTPESDETPGETDAGESTQKDTPKKTPKADKATSKAKSDVATSEDL